MAKLILISWRDLPAQVLIKRGRDTAKVQLSQRFQEAVDRAAMRAGKSSSNDYLNDWKRSEPSVCGDDIEVQAKTEAARIEAAYSDEDLLRIIRAHGVDESLAQPYGSKSADASASAGAAEAG